MLFYTYCHTPHWLNGRHKSLICECHVLKVHELCAQQPRSCFAPRIRTRPCAPRPIACSARRPSPPMVLRPTQAYRAYTMQRGATGTQRGPRRLLKQKQGATPSNTSLVWTTLHYRSNGSVAHIVGTGAEEKKYRHKNQVFLRVSSCGMDYSFAHDETTLSCERGQYKS
jgi:hypothetical protein